MTDAARSVLGYAAMLALAVMLFVAHNVQIRHEYRLAREHFVQAAKSDAERAGHKVESAFRSIHENIKMISRLPSVINIDRQGANITVDGRETLLQIYGNLTNGVAISGIYIAPADFDPDEIDPHTRAPLEPIRIFEGSIVRSDEFSRELDPIHALGSNPGTGRPGLNSVTIFEYRQLARHQKWFKQNHPTLDTIDASSVPMIASPEFITSDNTRFARTGDNADRTGLMFSVPFYGPDGALKGSISTTVLSHAFRQFLPPKHHALYNAKYRYISQAHHDGQERNSAQWVRFGAPDPDLVASTIIGLEAYDPRSNWRLWGGLPNSAFYDSPAVRRIWLFEVGGYAGIALLLSSLLFMAWLVNARSRARHAADVAEATMEAHGNTLKAERETRRLNEKLEAKMRMLSKVAAETREAHAKTLDAERATSRLNEKLEANMTMLADAQMEVVKHERLSTLGQVTATMSHEIRNPLGAIASSLYVLREAVNKAKLKLDRPLDRIERSVSRCNNLIGDFLEYTCTNELALEAVDAREFLNGLLDEQSPPNGIALTRKLPTPGAMMAIDPDRFGLVIKNFVENAVQAIRDSGMEGGKINVLCRRQGEGTLIRVQDNGPGMPERVLERIFEPLFTTKSFGAGLGLATVKQLVERHHGKLTVDTDVGSGTAFTVVLPNAFAAMAGFVESAEGQMAA